MGTFMMVQEARKSGGAKWVQSHIQGNGGASGGTIASLLNIVAKVPLKTIRDPHLLDTPGVRTLLAMAHHEYHLTVFPA